MNKILAILLIYAAAHGEDPWAVPQAEAFKKKMEPFLTQPITKSSDHNKSFDVRCAFENYHEAMCWYDKKTQDILVEGFGDYADAYGKYNFETGDIKITKVTLRPWAHQLITGCCTEGPEWGSQKLNTKCVDKNTKLLENLIEKEIKEEWSHVRRCQPRIGD